MEDDAVSDVSVSKISDKHNNFYLYENLLSQAPSLAMTRFSLFFLASQAAISKAHLLPWVTPLESQTGMYSIVQTSGQFSRTGDTGFGAEKKMMARLVRG